VGRRGRGARGQRSRQERLTTMMKRGSCCRRGAAARIHTLCRPMC
jgi:hypothetical protein